MDLKVFGLSGIAALVVFFNGYTSTESSIKTITTRVQEIHHSQSAGLTDITLTTKQYGNPSYVIYAMPAHQAEYLLNNLNKGSCVKVGSDLELDKTGIFKADYFRPC